MISIATIRLQIIKKKNNSYIRVKSEIYITVNTDRSDERFGETVGITESEYEALPENEKSGFGKITVIDGVENFWDETIALLIK